MQNNPVAENRNNACEIFVDEQSCASILSPRQPIVTQDNSSKENINPFQPCENSDEKDKDKKPAFNSLKNSELTFTKSNLSTNIF